MPLAFNDSGDAMYFNGKSWLPAPMATNDKGEKLVYDGSQWASIPPSAKIAKPSPESGGAAKGGDLFGDIAGKAQKFIEEGSGSPALGRIAGATVSGALHPSGAGPDIDALTAGASQGSQEAGRKTEEVTKPYLGDEGSRLAGAGVAGAVMPLPGVGIAARAGYGLASAAGEDIAGHFTDNPYIKAAAGFVAPLVAGPLARGTMRGVVGAKDIIGGATEATDEATETNLKAQKDFASAQVERATSAQKIYDEAANAADTAREKASALNEKELKMVAKAEQRGARIDAAALRKARDAAEEARQEAIAHNEAATRVKSQLEAETTRDLAPAAKTAAIEQATGRTAVASEAEVTMGQSPERIARNEQFRDNTIGPLQRWRQDWAARRDNALAPIINERTDAPELVQAVQEQTGELGKGAALPPKVASLYKRAKLVAGFKEGDSAFGGDFTEADVDAMEDGPRKDFYRGLLQNNKGTAPKVSDLIALQSDANAVARSLHGPARRQAMAVVRGVDETLTAMDAPTPQLKALNAEYRDHRTNFPYKFEDAVTGAARPVDAAKEIFDEPQRTLDIYNGGTSEEQTALKRLYGDAVHTNGSKFIKADHAPFLKQAFKGTALERPDSWVTLPDKEVATADVIGSSPEVADRFNRTLDAAFAKEADKLSMRDPQQAAHRAAIQSLMEAPEATTIPQANLIDPQATATRAGMESLQKQPTPAPLIPPIPTDPRQAALGAIAQGRLAKGSSTSISALKNRFMRYGAVSLGLGIGMGRVSPGIAGLGAFSAAELLRVGIQHGFQWSLKQSPKMAESFYMAMTKPAAPISQQILARGIAAAAISDVTGKMAEPEPQPSDILTAPAVRSGLTEVRVGKPGESHDDIERRMPAGPTERGFIDKAGKFLKRKDATDAVSALGGDHKPVHSSDLPAGDAAPIPGPVSIGDTPMRQFASAALTKAVPPPKQAALRDYDEAARLYRKGDVGALNAREWLAKGLTPQDLAEGWRRSKMGRVESALHQLPLPAVAQAMEIADNPKDASIARRVLGAKLSRGGWQALPPEEKQKLAPVLRRVLVSNDEATA